MAQLVDSVKKLPPMFAPETQTSYSNTNFVLLGMVIEKVTGTSMAKNYQTRIFDPLKRSGTSAPGTSTEIGSPVLSGISDQTKPEGEVKNATNWNPSFASTAGEVISTLDDLHNCRRVQRDCGIKSPAAAVAIEGFRGRTGKPVVTTSPYPIGVRSRSRADRVRWPPRIAGVVP